MPHGKMSYLINSNTLRMRKLAQIGLCLKVLQWHGNTGLDASW